VGDLKRCYDIGRQIEELHCKVGDISTAVTKKDAGGIGNSLVLLTQAVYLSPLTPEAHRVAEPVRERVGQLLELIGNGEHTPWRKIDAREAWFLREEIQFLNQQISKIGEVAGKSCGVPQSGEEAPGFRPIGADLKKIAKKEQGKAAAKAKAHYKALAKARDKRRGKRR
jgi:hypothetical protein